MIFILQRKIVHCFFDNAKRKAISFANKGEFDEFIRAFNQLKNKENVIVKIDIEGGEEQLMASNTNWLKDCSLMAIEIHDRCHPAMYNSSTNVINALSKAKREIK